MSVMERPAVESDASQRLIENATEGMLGPNPFIGFRPQDITAAFRELAHQAVQHPAMVLEQEAALLRELIAILSGSSKLAAAPGDRRFADAAWQENPLYRICLQTYLAWANSVTQFLHQPPLDQRTKQRVRFAASLLTDACAPTNTLFGNPAALRSTLASGGANLLAGSKNMLADMATNGAMPSQVDKSAFKLGENLALSKGAVVLTTPVLELIQYSPATDAVHARPHLIVPPQINKFYFFDLSPGRSIVEHLTQNQFQVFAISWRNPTAAERDWDMQTYVAAIREAIETITDITSSPDVIVHAACSGAMSHRAGAGGMHDDVGRACDVRDGLDGLADGRNVGLHVPIALRGGRIAPADCEHLELVLRKVFDDAASRRQVEKVELVDLRRDDQVRPRVNRIGRGGILDQLEHGGRQHHGAF